MATGKQSHLHPWSLSSVTLLSVQEAGPSEEASLQAPLSPLHELGGNLHGLADVASLQVVAAS